MDCDEHCINFCRLRSEIRRPEVLARGFSIRERTHLIRRYGHGQWRKMKGAATIETFHGAIREAEVHWYEAHGIGRRRIKWKKLLD